MSEGGQEASRIAVDSDGGSSYERQRLDTCSLRDSITNYYYENGRRYHAYHEGTYWGPNDEKASDHLDISHHLYTLLLRGRLYLAPIPDNPERVLDIGTGTGIWAMDFADQHPTSTIIGTDLSPIQPTSVPPNVQFEIDDCEDEWLYPKNSFDFIHVRGLYGCVSDWDRFYQQAFRHMRPGGYIEQAEQTVVPKSDDGTTNGTIFEKWGQVSLEAGDAFGKSLRMADEARQKIAQAGFVDVVEKRFKCPVGPWAKDPHLKELGLYNRLNWDEGLEGWTLMLLTKVLGWKPIEVELYLAQMRQGLHNKDIHAYHEITIVYARKPPLPVPTISEF